MVGGFGGMVKHTEVVEVGADLIERRDMRTLLVGIAAVCGIVDADRGAGAVARVVHPQGVGRCAAGDARSGLLQTTHG